MNQVFRGREKDICVREQRQREIRERRKKKNML
jgi:hypothetical protein